MGAKLLLGEEKEALFDAQVAFEIACKVGRSNMNRKRWHQSVSLCS